MIKYPQIKTIILITILTISGIALGAKPDAMPQSTYDAIINQVISEHGYYHASEVEEGVSQWLLDQPLPTTDGELIESGNCSNCTAGGNHSTASGFNQPRKVKVQAKLRPNGKFPSVLKIKWKRPKALDASLVNDYQVSHYLIYISKDNQSYEILRKDAKYKTNGKLKRKQRIRFKDRSTGSYQVQVSAIYIPTSTRANSKNLNGTNKASSTKVVTDQETSPWTPPLGFNTQIDPTTVAGITGALKVCLNANGYPDAMLLLDIQKDLYCSNQNLQDSDIVQLQLLSNIRVVNLKNNPGITDVSDLFNLTYLEYLVLSDNPGMISPDFDKFTALRNLYMENMGLTTIPLLSTNSNLKILDLSGNQITSGFENLPENLIVIELDNNQNSNTCIDLVASGNEYQIVNISANNNNLSDCVNVKNIKYLNVIGGDFPLGSVGFGGAVNQDVGDFINGLCGLSLISTNIEQLTGSMALQQLNLQDNVSLKKVEPVIVRLTGGLVRRPHIINISEDDNNLLCSNKFSMQNSNVQVISGDEILAGCPVIFAPEIINLPTHCAPDPVQSIQVYSDDASFKRILTWTDNPDAASIWGVEYYKIFGTRSGENISYNTVGVNEEKIFHFNTTIPDKYEIIACTNFKCGYPQTIFQTDFQAGISAVTGAVAEYIELTPAAKKFTLSFNYTSTATSLEAKPTRFEFSSDMDTTFSQTRECTSQCSNGSYTSVDITYYSGLGSALRIRACNDFLGCGAATSVDITPILISADIPVPNWTIAGHDPNDPIILEWNFPAGTTIQQADYVDYFEITEWKPQGAEDGIYPTGVDGNTLSFEGIDRTETRFYVENEKPVDMTQIHSIELMRVVMGYYDYNIRACKRNRGDVDICSEYAGGILEVPGTQSNGDEGGNCLVPPLNDLCRNGHSDTYDFIINHGSQLIPKPPSITNLGWSLNNGKYSLEWDSFDRVADYFYIAQDGNNNSAQNNCGLNNDTSLKFKLNFSDAEVQTSILKTWTTSLYCDDLGAGTKWIIKACRNGQGCGAEIPIDIDDTLQHNQTQGDLTHSQQANPQFGGSGVGGPGDFLPGMWWNPELSGTGWHFYWASELRYESTHENYGNTYDLIGYWFAYKQDKGRGIWSPTWFETRLKRMDVAPEIEGEAIRGCFEGDILSYNKPGIGDVALEEINVGNLQVCFKGSETTSNNTSAILLFDINESTGILTQVTDVANLGPYKRREDGRLMLDISDFSLGIIGGPNSNVPETPNDADHYSGLWQHQYTVNNETYADISMLTWIERGLEVSTLALYDDQGEPIWFQAANCGGDPVSCAASGAGYFEDYGKGPQPNQQGTPNTETLLAIAYGYNPISGRPIDFGFEDIIKKGATFFYGRMGRCLNTGINNPPEAAIDNLRFRKARLWYEFSSSFYEGDATITDRIVASKGVTTGECSANDVQLTKTASLHDIRFTILDQIETETTNPLVCNPNDGSGANYCDIKFQWFTDDNFPDITAFYSKNGEAYQPLVDSEVCSEELPNPDSVYVVPEYLCHFTDFEGLYTFQLRKNKYDGTGLTEVIAESEQLTVIKCEGECISPNDPNPTISLVEDEPPNPINSNTINHQLGAGPIPGSGGVSGGAATYNLPLAIPPGRNGMTPSVSVNYSSKGGNGTLGLGWSISTGSSIYRCPQTLAQDGKNHAVDFTTGDRLCLDGQRLMLNTDTNILPSDSDYWTATQGYRTEQNSFSKITKLNSLTFEVQTKSGRTNTYIQQQSPFVPPPENGFTTLPQRTTWQLTQEKDTFGNTINYTYTDRTDSDILYGEHEWLIKTIAYTRSAGTPSNRIIRFNYQDRQKGYSTKYLSDEKTETTQRLADIVITTPAGLHRTYGFEYVPGNIEGLLLLEKVTEKAGTKTRTLFEATWQGDQLYRMIKAGNIGLDPIVPEIIPVEDIIEFNERALSQTDPDSNQLFDEFGGVGTPTVITRLNIAPDLNGDGSKELVANGDTLMFYTTKGDLKGYLGLTGRPLSLINGRAHADYNNDGITDLMLFPINDTSNYEMAFWKGADFDTNTSTVNDVTEIFRFYDTGIPRLAMTTDGLGFNRDIGAADFNNDGLPDLIYTRQVDAVSCAGTDVNRNCNRSVYVRNNQGLVENECTGVAPNRICTYNPVFSPEPLTPIAEIDVNNLRSSFSESYSIKDINQDGYADILLNDPKGGLIEVYFYNLSGNLNNFTPISAKDLGLTETTANGTADNMDQTFSLFTDLNADGLEDLLYIGSKGRPNEGQWRYKLNTGKIDNGQLFANDAAIGITGIPLVCGADNRCKPKDAAGVGLFLSDINSDGINDLLIPNKDDVLIDVCVTADVVFQGGVPLLYHNNIGNTDFRYDATICSSVPDPSSPQSFDFYDYNGAFAGNDRSVYGYKAFILGPTINNSDNIIITAQEADPIQYPTVYKALGTKSVTGDFFGDGDDDHFSRVVCQWLRMSGGQGGALGCNASVIKFNEHTTDQGTLALNQYIADNYVGMTPDEAMTEISNNIVITDGDEVPGEFFITRNDSTTAGLVAAITKPDHDLDPGNNQTVSWTYKPLSTDESIRSDFPLYTIPDRFSGDSYVEEEELAGEHFYFNSSMYVVADMRQTNNYGNNSLNEYAYEEAVFNNQGRGFQGFRKISVRSNPDEGSIYETTSESIFHQVFPLAGKLESVKVTATISADVEVKINEEHYCYDGQSYNTTTNKCDTTANVYDADGPIVFHPLNFKHSKNYELNNGHLASDSITNISYDHDNNNSNDDYGTILMQTNTINTYQADPDSPTTLGDLIRSETTETTNSYYNSDENNWWIDKLLKTTVTKSIPDNNEDHITHSEFYWQSNNQRMLDCQFTYIGSDTITGCNSAINNIDISKNEFTYDTQDNNQNNNYGNITEVTTKALDHNGTISSRTVKTTYDTDGYFPMQITKVNTVDPAYNQLTNFSYDIATGQVTQTIQPDGNYVTTLYDAYGFKREDKIYDSTDTKFAPTSHSNLRDCNNDCIDEQAIVDGIKNSNSLLGMITGSPQLKYYTEQRQDGQPHVLTWYDSANNPVLTKTFHSDNVTTGAGVNNKYNYVVNITSPLGVSVISTQPFVNASAAYPTIMMADVQGRIEEKITHIGNLSNNSADGCQLETIYTHIGGLTEITATYSGNNCSAASAEAGTLNMSRLYDATGKLLSTTDADNNTVSYQYDQSGNPSQLIDAEGHTIYTTFDDLGRKTQVIDPNMGTKTFQYNGFGEVIEQIDAENNHSYYQYDSLGRIYKQYSNVNSFFNPLSGTRSYKDSYTYDSLVIGQLTKVVRASNMANNECGSNCFQQHYKKKFAYDPQNRVVSETTTLTNALTPHNGTPNNGGNDNADYITKFYYDGNYNRLKQVIYDDSYSVENKYTQYGALVQQVDALTGTILMEVTDWNDKGQETNRVFNILQTGGSSNMGSETSYYPSTGQIKGILNKSANGGIEQLNYQYDAWGNIKTQSLNRNNNLGANSASELFSYDKLHRLKTATVNNGTSKTYLYDALGNITKKSDFSDIYTYGGDTTNPCDGTSQPGPNAVCRATLIESNGTINYFYDNRGNRIKDSIGGTEKASYIYDYNNLLIESNSTISNPVNQILEFNYGADNQRYRKYDKINNEITLYANKDYEEIYDISGSLKQQKYYITSYMTITKDQQTGRKVNFMQKDRLGSTTQILDESGTVLHTKSYDAFGKPRNGDWSDMAGGLFQAKLDFNDANGTIDLTKRGFTDHEHLDEMQLIHMNGRMYDYNNARFLSVDPFIQAPTSTQSLNPYTYIFNNPLSGTDPTGYTAEDTFTVTGSHIRFGSEKGGVGGKTADFRSEGGKERINLDGTFVDNGSDSIGTKGSFTLSGGNLSDKGSQDDIKFTPSEENQFAQVDDDFSVFGLNLNSKSSDLPRPQIMDNSTKFAIKQATDIVKEAGNKAAIITAAVFIPYWGCVGGCSVGVFVLETVGVFPPLKGIGPLRKSVLKGLETRGVKPAVGERTVQGQVDAATQAGNPTIQRNGQDLFRLRSSGHGQTGATATPQNVRNVTPDGRVFTGKGADRAVTDEDIIELYKAQTKQGTSTTRTRSGG